MNRRERFLGIAAAVLSLVANVGWADGAVKKTGNVVVNPCFREGSKGWSLPKQGWKAVAGEGMDHGEGALVWENSDPNFYAFPVQHFEARPGVAYRFRVLVREDSLEGNRLETGLEWSSTAGKWLGGSYGWPVYDNDVSIKDGWVKYEITTGPMPADVGRCGVFCAVKKGATGRVRFSRFSVEPDVQEPVAFFVSSAFRDEAAEDRVGFFAGLHVNVIDHPFKDHAAEIRFMDAKGHEAVRKPETFTVDRAVFNLKAEDLAPGAQDVRFRLLAKGKEIATATRRFTRLEKSVTRHIAFDSARRVLIDGKPVFLLGMYGAPNDPAGLDQYLEAPFNFTTLYGLSDRRRLDPYAERGIYVANDVRMLIDGYDARFKGVPQKTREQSRAAIKAKVDEIGDHPALLFWYLTDEVPYNLISNVAAANDSFHAFDAEHPTFSVQNNPKEAEWYLPCCDVLATDCYPIGNHGRPISAVGGWVRQADDLMGGFRPCLQVPQAINWAWYFKGKDLEQPDLRFPRREELANMCWQSIAAGANGLCLYAFNSMKTWATKPPETFEACWARVVDVAKELRRLERVILSDPSDLKPKALPPETFFRAWTDGTREMALFVNATRRPLTANLAFSRKFAASAAALGPAPKLATDGRSVALELPPLGVTVFSLRP